MGSITKSPEEKVGAEVVGRVPDRHPGDVGSTPMGNQKCEINNPVPELSNEFWRPSVNKCCYSCTLAAAVLASCKQDLQSTLSICMRQRNVTKSLVFNELT